MVCVSMRVIEGKIQRQAPTVIVERFQIPYDVLRTSTYSRVGDVHNVYSLAGERQHVEFQLHLIAVQLEGK